MTTSFPILLDQAEEIEDIKPYDGIMGLAPVDDSSGPLFVDYLFRDNKLSQDKFSILPGTNDVQPRITFGGYQEDGFPEDKQHFFNASTNSIIAHRASGSFHWELDLIKASVGGMEFRPSQHSVLTDTGTSMIMIYFQDLVKILQTICSMVDQGCEDVGFGYL